MNVYDDDWGKQPEDWSGGGGRSKPLPRSDRLGATLYELDPGNFVVLHFHHAWDELLIVLGGRPTLRTGEGERQLKEGEVVFFPTGPEGVHGLRNDTGEAVRYVMVSTLGYPEVAEYPELKQITAQAPTGSQTGERQWLIHDVQ